MHYYRMVVEQGAEFGEVLSCHRTEAAAQRVNRTSSTCAVVPHLKELDAGRLYPEIAEAYLASGRHQQYLNLMLELIELRKAGDPRRIDRFCDQLVEYQDIDLATLESRYAGEAQQVLAARELQEHDRVERLARRRATQADLEMQCKQHVTAYHAVVARQGTRPVYLVQVSFADAVRLLSLENPDIDIADRYQRRVDLKRARRIVEYLAGNPADFILPTITASCDGSVWFEPDQSAPGRAGGLSGALHIPAGACIWVTDGQHRRAALEILLAEQRWFKDYSVPLMLCHDGGVRRLRQDFVDLNRNQVKPPTALSLAFEQRSRFVGWVTQVLDAVPDIRARTDFEHNSVGRRSERIWSLTGIHKVLFTLTGLTDVQLADIPASEVAVWTRRAELFFSAVRTWVPCWEYMLDGEMDLFRVRNEMVIAQTVFLEALAIAGRQLVEEDGHFERFAVLASLDVSRSAALWQGRCVVAGRMNRTASGLKSTAAQLCLMLGGELSADLIDAHDRVLESASLV